MNSREDFGYSAIATHRLEEAKRRVQVLEDYTADRITKAEAMERLQISLPSLYRLARAWRKDGRPEALGAAGRHRDADGAIDDAARLIVDEVEARLEGASARIVVQHARTVGEERGIGMPAPGRIARYVTDRRAARGERPDGVDDLFIGFCAVDAPVAHPERGAVAPIMCVLVAAVPRPRILGLSLSVDDPAPGDVVRTLRDALSRQLAGSGGEDRKLLLQRGWEGPWKEVIAAMAGAGLCVDVEWLAGRSARSVTSLIGNRPGGIRLKGDLTAREAAKRTLKVPSRGTAADIADVEALLRSRLIAGHPPAAAFANGERLARALEDLA